MAKLICWCRNRRAFVILVVCTVVCLFLLVVVATNPIDTSVRSLRDAGAKVSFKELADSRQEGSASDWMQLLTSLPSIKDARQQLAFIDLPSSPLDRMRHEFSATLSESQLETAKEQISERHEVFAQLELLGESDVLNPPIVFDEGFARFNKSMFFTAGVRHADLVSSANELILTAAIVESSKRNYKVAVENCIASIEFTNRIRIPGLNWLNHQSAEYAKALTVMAEIIAASQQCNISTDYFDRLVAKITNESMLRSVVEEERAIGISAYKNLPKMMPIPGVGRSLLALYRREFVAFLEMVEAHIQVVGGSATEVRQVVQDHFRSPTSRLGIGGASPIYYNRWRLLDEAHSNRRALRALVNCVRAIAMIRSRESESKSYESVASIVRNQAISDPFTNEPLVIANQDEEWLVYSRGWNRRDDGGSVADFKDLGFRFNVNAKGPR